MRKKETLWLKRFSEGQRLRVWTLCVSNAVFSVSTAVFALLTRRVVNGALGGEKDVVLAASIGLGVIVLLQLFLRLMCGSIEEGMRARTETELRGSLLKNIMEKDYTYVSEYSHGEIFTRLTSDVSRVSEGIVEILPAFVNMSVRLACAWLVMLLLDTRFALLFISASALLYAFTRFFRWKIKMLHLGVREYESRVKTFLRETVERLLVVKVFGAEEKILGINDENGSEYLRSRMRRRTAAVAGDAGFSFVFKAAYLYAAIWGALGILAGVSTVGTLAAILQLIGQVQSPCAGLSSLPLKYRAMLASARRIMELENLPEDENTGRKLAPDYFERLEVSGLSYFLGENEIIRDARFSVERGDFVSLAGISEAGKSSLLRLLLGAELPDGGEIRFFSGQSEYRAGSETCGLFAYVPKENSLFSGTIRENISFLNEGARDDEIRSAAKTACALEFVEALPDGFDTLIGEGGEELTEGQAQRIAIARAILGGAPILLLDEATEALDGETEARLLENIAALKNRTMIAVLHRSAALEQCGRHLTISEGVIAEEAHCT